MNSSRLSRATLLPVLVYFTFFGEVLGAETSTVRGSISLGQNGILLVTECTTNRVIPLGAMASTAYFRFTQNYEEVSEGGKVAVVVEVKGELDRSSRSKGEFVLNLPTISSYRRGACESTPRPAHVSQDVATLLNWLREKLENARQSQVGTELPWSEAIDLVGLIGAKKQDIQAGLGVPDYCGGRDACQKSDDWTYFFLPRTMFTLGGGCCALELEFNANSKVSFAKWQSQR